MTDVATSTPSTVEINDAIFCQHFKEVVSTHQSSPLSSDGMVVDHRSTLQCTECDYDGREENDAFFGVSVTFSFGVSLLILRGCLQYDPMDRGGLEAPPAIQNKEGLWQCKKHGSTGIILHAALLYLPDLWFIPPRLQPMLWLEEANPEGPRRVSLL